jgi:glycosyltransferase involved in cell wall biosynthesis
VRIAIIGPCSPREFADQLGLESGELPIGLGGTPVNSLVRSLLKLGHTVHLIGASPEIDTVQRFGRGDLAVSIVPYRRRARDRACDLFRKERRMMVEELRRVQVDVVHSHWSYEFGWVGVTSGLPNVLTVHDAPLTILRRMPDAYRLLRTVLAFRVRRLASNVTAVSPDLANKWKRQMRFGKAVRVVPNISPEFNLEKFHLSKPPMPAVITDIADSTRLKNVPRLLEAFGRFKDRIPGAELRLIGAGLGDEDELASWARVAGLSDGVQFLGRQNRAGVSRHLSESSMLCHASLEESQGMCFLEAMSHSVPVIGGRNSGGVAWTLDGGRAGLLVDVSNSEDILRGMLELQNAPAQRDALIKRGLYLVSERYSGAAVASAYVDSYEHAIANFGIRAALPS